jgi:hypothetical protein
LLTTPFALVLVLWPADKKKEASLLVPAVTVHTYHTRQDCLMSGMVCE